jgi:hypothetical protein
LLVVLLAVPRLASAERAERPPLASAGAPSARSPIEGSLHLGFEIGARWFRFSDPLKIATNLRPYDAPGVPLFALGGEVRPLRWTRVPVLEDVGIAGEYAFAPHLVSELSDGRSLDTSWDRGRLALRVPVRVGAGVRAPLITGVVGYEWLGFSFTGAGELEGSLPTVGYHLARVGAEGSVPLYRSLSLLVAFAYLAPAESGPLYDRFRDPSVGGIDARLGLGLGVARGMRVTVKLGYERFYSSFEPVPGDAYVAGGALDQFGGVEIGIDYAP